MPPDRFAMNWKEMLMNMVVATISIVHIHISTNGMNIIGGIHTNINIEKNAVKSAIETKFSAEITYLCFFFGIYLYCY